ncbi:MAG: flavin reductase family protein [Lachnospiraceae bacterium]|nr:flavin reductase family protein [Lachnospiraceae bacterium]
MGREVWKAGNMLYPLPAVMVSCARADERPNIITVAWAGTICSSPALVSISVKPERYSYGIIRETGEFVINLTTKSLARATDFCGVRSGREVDKFQEAHLTAIPATSVQAPLIEESPVNIECRVREVLELGSHHMFVAEVLCVDVDERYLDEKGKLHLNDAEPMVYSHGTYYALGESLGSFGYSVRRKPTQRRTSHSDASGRTATRSDASMRNFAQNNAPDRGTKPKNVSRNTKKAKNKNAKMEQVFGSY